MRGSRLCSLFYGVSKKRETGSHFYYVSICSNKKEETVGRQFSPWLKHIGFQLNAPLPQKCKLKSCFVLSSWLKNKSKVFCFITKKDIKKKSKVFCLAPMRVPEGSITLPFPGSPFVSRMLIRSLHRC